MDIQKIFEFAKRQRSGYDVSNRLNEKLLSKREPENEIQEFAMMNFDAVLDFFPVIKIAPELEPLITDTKVSKESFKNFKMPYPAFFIDKIFEIDSLLITGIAIYDALEVYSYITEKYPSDIKLNNLEKFHTYSNEWEEKNGNIYNRLYITFWTIYINPENGFYTPRFVSSCIDEVLNQTFTNLYHTTKEALNYALNVCLLMTNHINLKFPASHKSDYRLIPYYPDAKSKRANKNRFSVLKVFGETKQYVDSYNRERRKYNKHNLEAVVVRGHWRHLESERYKAKQGQTIWIAPFFRGKDRELYSRIVKVEP